jgi:circadian clock protein KaiB
VGRGAVPKKTDSHTVSATEATEKALKDRDNARYVLRLYITGMTPRSQQALRNIEKVCREHLADRFELEVIDIYQQPQLAKDDQIIAVPTLVKKLPSPLRRLIGDLSQEERILMGLDLKPKSRMSKRTREPQQ